jgi:hypothetical protein
MKILHFLILVPLSILSLRSTAQVEDLMQDKDITWIGAFTSDFVLEGYKALDTSFPINSAYLLKYLETKTHNFDEEETPFYYKLNYRNSPIRYSDSMCIFPLKAFTGADTIETINPITNEKVSKIIFRCFYVPPTPRYYRAAQILYYNKKRANFGLKTLAIGLIVDKHDETGEIIGEENEGWLKPKNIGRKAIDFNELNITIARRLVSRSNAPNLDNIKILKNTTGDILQTFLDDLSRKSSTILYTGDDYAIALSKIGRDTLLRNIQKAIAESKFPKDSSKLALQKDSVKIRYIYYNKADKANVINENDVFPDFTRMGKNDTTKQTPKIALDTMSSKEVVPDSFPEYIPQPLIDPLVQYGTKALSKLRIIQDWYWDEKLNTICVRLFAIAPMKKIYNEAGEFLFYMPLFYRLND